MGTLFLRGGEKLALYPSVLHCHYSELICNESLQELNLSIFKFSS